MLFYITFSPVFKMLTSLALWLIAAAQIGSAKPVARPALVSPVAVIASPSITSAAAPVGAGAVGGAGVGVAISASLSPSVSVAVSQTEGPVS